MRFAINPELISHSYKICLFYKNEFSNFKTNISFAFFKSHCLHMANCSNNRELRTTNIQWTEIISMDRITSDGKDISNNMPFIIKGHDTVSSTPGAVQSRFQEISQEMLNIPGAGLHLNHLRHWIWVPVANHVRSNKHLLEVWQHLLLEAGKNLPQDLVHRMTPSQSFNLWKLLPN